MCFKSGSHNKSQSKKTESQDNSVSLPDYLPEDAGIPVSKTVSLVMPIVTGVMVLITELDISLSCQALARVKKQEDKENQGWFGSVGNFISKTLYW